jgi:heptosyltransferase I
VSALRVLLVRTSALGDVVLALPVLAALRRHLPAARIGWTVDETFAPLLEGHALLDELFPVPLRRWRRGGRGRARELAGFARRLRAFRADVVLDLMGNHKGALLARLAGAPRRIGAVRAERREPTSALWLNERVVTGAGHSVERGLALLAALGLPVDAAGADFAPDAIACGCDAIPSGDYLYLHPGAAWGNKRYPAGGWGEVASRLADAVSVRVLVGAGPGEEALAEEVVLASRGAASLHPAPDLAALAGVLRGARLVLAGDTGPLHLARAFDRPVIAVHGPTDPRLHGPWDAPGAIVVHPLPCSYCHRRMDEAKPCLIAIAPREIAERAAAKLVSPAV